MSTSFWCSGCKVDHPGDCPTPPAPAGKAPPGYQVTLKPGVFTKAPTATPPSATATPSQPVEYIKYLGKYLLTDKELRAVLVELTQESIRRAQMGRLVSRIPQPNVP